MTKQLLNLPKEDIIAICEAMGFHLDYDQYDVEGKNWMRFQLKDELDEKDLRLIWWNDSNIENNLGRAGQILFKAGQKEKMLMLNRYTSL